MPDLTAAPSVRNGWKANVDLPANEQASSGVLTVRHSPPCVEPDDENGWQLTFWLGDPFDYSTPFREALAEIASQLPPGDTALNLPPYTADEDFVEGTLTLGPLFIRLYYEYALGYLSLMSTDRALLESVAEKVLPLVRVA